jgi:hypothetical protein
MNSDRQRHRADPEEIGHRRNLAEDDQSRDGRHGGKQRHEQGKGGAGQASHRQLVEHIWKYRGSDPDANAGADHDRVQQVPDHGTAGHRGDADGRNEHGGRQAIELG